MLYAVLLLYMVSLINMHASHPICNLLITQRHRESPLWVMVLYLWTIRIWSTAFRAFFGHNFLRGQFALGRSYQMIFPRQAGSKQVCAKRARIGSLLRHQLHTMQEVERAPCIITATSLAV